MNTMSMPRLTPTLLILPLLLISLSIGAAACSSEDEGRMWKPAASESEERRETKESVEEDEDEVDDAEIEKRESGEEEPLEIDEDKDPDEELPGPDATSTSETDKGIVNIPGGINRKGGSFADDVLALLPASDDLRDITAFDVRGMKTEGVPAALYEEIEGSYGFLESSYCIRLDEVETSVSAGWDSLFVKGKFSKDDFRMLLEIDGYGTESYKDYELWVNTPDARAIAFFEEQSAILMGREDSVRQVLKDLNRGNESFPEKESSLRRVYDATRDGLKVRMKSVCSGDYCRVLATAAVTAASEHEYAADIELVAMAESEDTAQSIRDDLKATIDEPSYIEVLDISASASDEFVIVRATIDEESVENWAYYSVPYSIFMRPSGAVPPAPAAAAPAGGNSSVPPQRECPPQPEGP